MESVQERDPFLWRQIENGAMGNITSTGFTNTISTMASTTTILRKTLADGSCEDIGSGEVLRGDGTLSDVLSCGLAGLPVTYCYCSPIGGASNTTILTPDLVANANSTSSTPDVLSLIVDVSDCIGMEQLCIRVTVNGGGISEPLEMVKPYSRRSDFTFSDLSPGNYTCSVSVEDENGVQELRNISCIAPGGLTNDELIVISVVLSLVCIILIGIGVVIAIYLCWLYHKRVIGKKRTEEEWEDHVKSRITAIINRRSINQRRGAIDNTDELLTQLN